MDDSLKDVYREAARIQADNEIDTYINDEEFSGTFREWLDTTPEDRAQGDFLRSIGDSITGQGSDILGNLLSSGVTGLTGSGLLGQAAGNLGSGLIAGAGAAAGPLALAGIVATVVSQINSHLSQTINQGMASIAGGITGGRSPALAPFASAASSATYALDPIEAITGLNLNIADDLLRGFVDAIQLATNNLEAMAEALAPYSGDVAVAFADRKVSRLETELYRDERIGPGLAEFVEVNTEIQESIEKIKIAFIELALPILTDILEGISFIVKGWADLAEMGGQLKDYASQKIQDLENFLVKAGFSPETAKQLADAIILVISPAAAYYLRMQQQSKGGKFLREVLQFLEPQNFIDRDQPRLP